MHRGAHGLSPTALGYAGGHNRAAGAAGTRWQLLSEFARAQTTGRTRPADRRPGSVYPGVSTRRVDDLVQALGMQGISKSQVSRMCAELEVQRFRARCMTGE